MRRLITTVALAALAFPLTGCGILRMVPSPVGSSEKPTILGAWADTSFTRAVIYFEVGSDSSYKVRGLTGDKVTESFLRSVGSKKSDGRLEIRGDTLRLYQNGTLKESYQVTWKNSNHITLRDWKPIENSAYEIKLHRVETLSQSR